MIYHDHGGCKLCDYEETVRLAELARLKAQLDAAADALRESRYWVSAFCSAAPFNLEGKAFLAKLDAALSLLEPRQ